MSLLLLITLVLSSSAPLAVQGDLVTIAPARARPHSADCESLHCAQLRVRELLAKGPQAGRVEDITVRIAPGSFGERDHATDGRHLARAGGQQQQQ